MATSIDQQFVEYIVKSLVNNPDGVKIDRRIDEKGVLLELTATPLLLVIRTVAPSGTLVSVMVCVLFDTIVAQPVVSSAATAHARIDLAFIQTP